MKDTAEPSREQLQLAFRQLRRPSGWPASLDAALQHPVYGICLRAMARTMGRPKWVGHPVAPSLPTAPVPPTPTAVPAKSAAPAPIPRKRRGKRSVDLKRAAANDRDDDTEDDDTDADQ